MQQADDRRRARCAASTLAKPAATTVRPCRRWRAHRARPRSSSRSVCATRSGGTRELALEAAREGLARDRVAERRRRRRDPDAAAGQLALEIGHQRAVRPDDETDQLGDRLHRAGQRAQPLGAGTRLCAVRRRASSCCACVPASVRVSVLHAGARLAASAGGLASAAGGARSASVIQPALNARLHDQRLGVLARESRSRRGCRARARSRRPCARSSRRGRRWRSRRDPRPS